MNIEVEIKIGVDNLDAVREKVAVVGKLIKSINQIDDYYVPAHRDFFAHKPQPVEWMRVRTNPDKAIFEYDKAVNMKEDGSFDGAEEYETEVSSPEELRKILDFLDFRKVVTVNKQREYWDCGKIEIALDKIEGLGCFVEAEAKGDFKDNAEAKKACIEFLESLGVEDVKSNQINKGYPVLLLEKVGK